MKDLIIFLKKIYVVVLFLILEGGSLYFFFSKDTFMLSRCMLLDKKITILSDRFFGSFNSYISLERKNSELADYNAMLIAENSMLKNAVGDSVVVDLKSSIPMVCAAKVLRNELRYENNFITIDKGEKDGVKSGMSVVDENGIVGFVSNTSSSFSVVVSIFNKGNFKTSAKLAGTPYTGSLSWDGSDYRRLTLTGMPSHINLHVGDTILTTSYSNIFLENMPIGRVADFSILDGTFYNVDVEVFADMEVLDYVYVIEMKDKYERDSLENVVKLQGGAK